ncbi:MULTISPECIES: DUF4150 domain-containing protein [unclassified Mesorhizobium]|uniref:DUF4150 domain-containing protein n=1 Tax=unclassified Mesorhizobium TaxID=325217 RepID=UPI001CCEE662|nr:MULTISPECIES: DUF4150 domain-containing protein [unclassified Mesorhizobium]MBZ9734248.1 DUF4150 domain-containing protein [Mesorhizobium sp. CA9]MBZ9766973.1 DUF4150 domain-containing protein [Mesorhizobium sp. CA6]MBZ9824529.1 DUF4150 domain-containing protein [Mesorhizobium sp. CA18]MBZ9829513.1 DUF4150 domain-containing protein [Mesorhizobium sp. CA2]MBZ9837212.1 DUF4150 domain-containing protein [Mesorhizobium sp. CA3]
MSNVFANYLEISGKAVNAQTIAAFPDVCFTPPQTPATPPGVPIPYPSFGMASDTENGTGTVKIAGEEVNIKNKSDEKRTSGTEAGCAPKKGIITSQNTGKKYFNMWSPDVKFEGEPVIRFSDIATHNHASPGPNTPPWPEICKFSPNMLDCETILADFELHRHGDEDCPHGYESEHFVQNEYLQWERGEQTATQFENYNVNDAPCICMESYAKGPNGGFRRKGGGSKAGSPHNLKTKQCNDAIRKRTTTPTLSEMIDECTKAVVDNDPRAKNAKPKPKAQNDIQECLRAAFMEYLDRAVKSKDKKNSAAKAAQQPIAWEVNSDPERLWAR